MRLNFGSDVNTILQSLCVRAGISLLCACSAALDLHCSSIDPLVICASTSLPTSSRTDCKHFDVTSNMNVHIFTYTVLYKFKAVSYIHPVHPDYHHNH